jgi:hypothetical protein
MLHLLKGIFKTNQLVVRPTPVNFSGYCQKAIALLTASNGQLEDEQLLALFEANDIPAEEAVELLLFLPIAFCRRLLTQVNWPNYYVEYTPERKAVKCLFKDNERYAVIEAALAAYISTTFYQQDYLKIAGRSASFHSLNKLLLDNPGTDIAILLVSAEHLIRR